MRIILVCFLALLTSNAFSQNIDLSLDSIKTLLCKKWEVSYAIMGNARIGRIPGATEINHEFSKDGTFITTSDDPTDKTKGSWNYDSKKKLIKLIIGGRSTGQIISLKDDEFLLQMSLDKSGSSDTEIKMVYKPKTSASTATVKKTTTSSTVHLKNASLKNPDSAILYVGVQNMIEIEGAQSNISISVTGATIQKVADTKFIVIPSRQGSIVISVSQNFKMIASKQYTAVLPKK
jgi:hypothetical protein